MTDIAICIRHWDYSETSQTVGLFTREHGLIRGLAKGAKREKGRFSGGIDLLTRGHVGAIIKPGRELATLTEWDVVDPSWHLRSNLAAYRSAVFFADLVHRMVTDHDPHSLLFDRLTDALAALADPQSIEGATLGFQWSLLTETGYRPQVERDAETGRPLLLDGAALAFCARAGGVVEDATARPGRWRVRPETVEVLRGLAARGQVDTSASDASIQRASRLLAAYLRQVLGEEPPTLRWRFPDMPEPRAGGVSGFSGR